MAMMKLQQTDPDCGECIFETTVELSGNSPVQFIVHVKIGNDYPPENGEVSNAELTYKVGANRKTETLGPGNGGPDWPDWTPDAQFDVQFDAESWLKESDFDDLYAKMDVTASTKNTFQEWSGVE